MRTTLPREDAERLGFNTGIRWREMLRTQTQALASNLKIPMENLRWYAAFHNESHHPHIHLLAYSVIENEGYLTKQGVHNLRSSFAKDIFAQDLLCTYEKQTEHRDSLRRKSREVIREVVERINSGIYDNPKLEQQLIKLADRLSRTGGKKVYGYLKAGVKAIIDSIPADMNYPVLADTARYYKEDKEGLSAMCKAVEDMITDEKKEIALRMIEKGKLPLEEIAEYSDLSLEEVQKLADEELQPV